MDGKGHKMRMTFTVQPRRDLKECEPDVKRIFSGNDERKYTLAYVGPYSYLWNLTIDNAIEFSIPGKGYTYNLQIGNSNSIGSNLECVFAKNHVYSAVSLGGVEISFAWSGINKTAETASKYRQKGSIIIQNDTWIGENSTVMGGVTIHNGAVVARNSHVVTDVPPYAIVGGNPAKIIGYRFTDDIIKKLQTIQWWYWSKEKLIENLDYFNEDVEGFCNRFYDEAAGGLLELQNSRKREDDAYFCFVDYYENYSAYPHIISSFLDEFLMNTNKRLVLFVQMDYGIPGEGEKALDELRAIVEKMSSMEEIKCRFEIVNGNINQAKDKFLECSHYIISRTYDAVYFSCLADLLDMDVISGVDSVIPFSKSCYMIKTKE